MYVVGVLRVAQKRVQYLEAEILSPQDIKTSRESICIWLLHIKMSRPSKILWTGRNNTCILSTSELPFRKFILQFIASVAAWH